MTDDCPPQGIRRPDLADLQEPDELTEMCADAICDIRALFAAAKDRASVWHPSRGR
jgi:hypothetical protein